MKVYLAGFDVFKPDADTIFAALCLEARRLNLIPLSPADCEMPDTMKGADLAKHIFAANVKKLSEAEAVIANLAPFRGHEPDSGTVFEVGYAIARGIPVIGYGVPIGTYADRLQQTRTCGRCDAGMLREKDTGWLVEDFGLPLNLMLSCSIELQATAEDALQILASRRQHQTERAV